MCYEEHPDNLEDAIIEDTCHCKLCGCSIVCGDPDCLIHEDGWSICAPCGLKAFLLYYEALRQAGSPIAEALAELDL